MVTWRIKELYVAPELNGQANVVTQVAWECEGASKQGGRTNFDSVGSPFIAYADLTESEVLNWVWSVINKTLVELDASTPAIIPAPTDLKPLPWSS